MEFSIGQIIFSKAGRDKRRPFVVVNIEAGYLFLADGRLRPVHKPKKKKEMHVQPTNIVDDRIADIIKSEKLLLDSDVRNLLRDFCKEEQ